MSLMCVKGDSNILNIGVSPFHPFKKVKEEELKEKRSKINKRDQIL